MKKHSKQWRNITRETETWVKDQTSQVTWRQRKKDIGKRKVQPNQLRRQTEEPAQVREEAAFRKQPSTHTQKKREAIRQTKKTVKQAK